MALRQWYEEPGIDGGYWNSVMQNGVNIITSGTIVTSLRNGTFGTPTGKVNLKGNFAVPWVIGKSTDPLVTVTNGSKSIQVHIPLGTVVETPTSQFDQSIGGTDQTKPYLMWSISGATINTGSVQASGSVITGTYGFQIDDAAGNVMCDAVTNQPGTNNSFGNVQDYHLNKLRTDPNYVMPMMAYCLDPSQAGQTGPVWPLKVLDGGSVNTGPIPQGLTIAIPPSVTRPTGKTRGFYAWFDMLQQRGALMYNLASAGATLFCIYSNDSTNNSLITDMTNSLSEVMGYVGYIDYTSGVSGSQYSLATVKGKTPTSSNAFTPPGTLDLSPTSGVAVAPHTFGAWYPSLYDVTPTPPTSQSGGGTPGTLVFPTQTIDVGNVLNYQFIGLPPNSTWDMSAAGYNSIGTGPSSNTVRFTTAAQSNTSTPGIVGTNYARFRDNATNGGTITGSLPNAPNSANTVLALFHGYGGNSASNAITAPSTFTRIYGPVNIGAEVFWAWAGKDNSNSYPFSNYASYDFSGMTFIEVSGAASFDFSNGSAGETGTSTSGAYTWPRVTPPGGANALRIVDISSNNSPASVTGGSGITVLSADTASDQFHGGCVIYDPVANTGTGSVTITGGNGQTTDAPAYVTLNVYGSGLPSQVTTFGWTNLTPSSVKLTWNLAAGATSYDVFVQGGSFANLTLVGTQLGSNVTNLQVNNLTPGGVQYTFYIYPGNSAGQATPTQTVVTTPASQILSPVQAIAVGDTTAGTDTTTLTATFSQAPAVGNSLVYGVTAFADTVNQAWVPPSGTSNWSGWFNDAGSDNLIGLFTQTVTTSKTAYSLTGFDDKWGFAVGEFAGVVSFGPITHGTCTYDDTAKTVVLPVTSATSSTAIGIYFLEMTFTPDSWGTIPSGLTLVASVTGGNSNHQPAMFTATPTLSGNQTIHYNLTSGTQTIPPVYAGFNIYGTTGATAPGQVVGVTSGTITQTTLQVTWNTLANATSYSALIRPTGQSTFTTAASGISGTTYTYTSLTASTGYDVEIVGYNGSTPGTASAILQRTTSGLAAPTAPTNLQITASSPTSLTWTWVDGTGTNTTHTFQYSNQSDTGPWTTVSGITGTTVTTNSLASGNTYYGHVAGLNGASQGPYSAVASGITQNAVAPGPVSNVAQGTATASTIAFTWTGPTTGGTATSYNVAWKLATSGTYTTITGIQQTSYTITGLPSANATYNVTVTPVSSGVSGPTSTPINMSTNAAVTTGGQFLLIDGVFQIIDGVNTIG